MRKKLTVTIGVPAYNEEANIGKLITSILKQKGKHFILKKIIVVSDRSTDNTDSIVLGFSKDKIKLLKNKLRVGQALSQNRIKNRVKTDLLILLNADILIPKENFIEKIVQPFILDKKVGIVCPEFKPLPSSDLFEKMINYSVEMKNSVYEAWKNGDNLYTSKGTARAFSSSFIKLFNWPKMVGEDAYTYLSAISKGMKYKYQKGNQIFYRSPSNFTDHRRQSRRFFANNKELSKYFPKDLVNKEFNIPISIFIKHTLKYFIKNPLLFVIYISVTLLANLIPGKKEKVTWNMANSTKNLISIN